MYKKLGILVLAIIVVAAGWYFLSPLVTENEINEEFPMASVTQDQREQMIEAAADLDMEIPALNELRQMTADEMKELENKVVIESKKQPDVEIEDTMPPAKNLNNEPKLFYYGEFEDADSFHKGEGTANIYQLSDQSWILRFENFKVTNGPDLRVLLSKNSEVTDSESLGEYFEVAKLKGNVGNQNYELPEDIDYSVYKSVVIYCKPFHVVFSTASLN